MPSAYPQFCLRTLQYRQHRFWRCFDCRKVTERLLVKGTAIKSLRRTAYFGVQVIWGLPQTLLGLVVFAAHAGSPHRLFHGAVVTFWESRKALSLGPFVFLRGLSSVREPPEPEEPELLVHEYGHTVQSLILGPLYLVIIGLPSVVWLNAAPLARLRKRRRISYYSFYTERSANWLGERVLGMPSVGTGDV